MTSGDLPVGWRWMSLSECLAEPLVNGKSHRTADVGFPVLRVNAIRAGKVLLHERKTAAWSENEARPFLVKEGDFFVVRGNGSLGLVGRGGLVSVEPDAVAFPDKFIRVRPRADVLDREFLSMVWDSEGVRAQLEAAARSTSGLYMIGQSAVSEVRIAVPPLPMQRRLLSELEEKLSGLDAALRNLNRSAANSLRLLAATRFAAVTGSLDNAGSSDTAGWESRLLGEIADVGTGATPLRGNDNYWVGGTIPWVTSGAVRNAVITQPTAYVTAQALSATNLTIYPTGTLVMAMYGEGKTRGRCAVLGIAAATNQALAAIQLRDASPRMRGWVKIVLDTSYDSLRRLSAGGVQPNLNLGLIRQIRIPIAPTERQERLLAEVESTEMACERVAHVIKLNSARAARLRTAILSAALTGRIAPAAH